VSGRSVDLLGLVAALYLYFNSLVTVDTVCNGGWWLGGTLVLVCRGRCSRCVDAVGDRCSRCVDAVGDRRRRCWSSRLSLQTGVTEEHNTATNRAPFRQSPAVVDVSTSRSAATVSSPPDTLCSVSVS